jgi:hypothetical protein
MRLFDRDRMALAFVGVSEPTGAGLFSHIGIDGRARFAANFGINRLRIENSPMQRLCTISRFVRVLVALFVVAQFAGVVSSPLASVHAIPNATASHVHHQHAHDEDCPGGARHPGDQSGHHGDYCCALHAFFAGLLPSAIAVETADSIGERLAPPQDGCRLWHLCDLPLSRSI